MFRRRYRGAQDAPPERSGDPPADAVEDIRAWMQASRDLEAVLASDTSEATANPDTAAHLRQRGEEISREEIDARTEARRAELAAQRRRREAIAARENRAVGEGIEDAESASADLRMIRDYERESSPVTAARALASSARRWRAADLGYAVTGSALSAVGITAALVAATPLVLGGAAVVAGALETVMTVRTVDLIGRIARLDEQRKTPQQKAAQIDQDNENSRTHLIIQAGVLLAASVLINVIGVALGAGWLGFVGVAGALLAAAAGLGSKASTRAATDVIATNLAAWKGEDWETTRAELRRRASGTDIPELSTDATGQAPTRIQHSTTTEPAWPGAAPPGTQLLPIVAPDNEAADNDGEEEQEEVRQALASLPGPDQLQALLDAIASHQLAQTPVPDDPAGLTGEDPGDDAEDTSSGGTRLLPRPWGNEIGTERDEDRFDAVTGSHTPHGNEISSEQDEQPAEAPARSDEDGEGDGIGTEQAERDPHHQARIQRGQSTRERIAAYLAQHPGAQTREIARELGLGRTTVREHRRALNQNGHSA